MSMGGGGKSNADAINAQREREAKAVAAATLKFQREEAEKNRKLSEKAAKEAIEREKVASADYTRNFGVESDNFMGRLESALSQFSGATNPIYSQLGQDIKDYGERSDGIATRSAQEATDYMLANESNFIRFADALTNSAFNTRQKLIAETNPFQIAQQQQAGRNNLDMLSGRMPADVMAATQRNSAYAALQLGYGATSSMGQAAQARNLGLTSLDLMAAADQSAQNWARSIFDTQINGLQVTSGQVADALGVKASDVMNINQANNVNMLTAQSDLAKQQLTGLNTALATRSGAYQDIFRAGVDVAGRRYDGNIGVSTNSANLQGAAYRTAATTMAAALQDYGNQRQSINSTAWQNALRSDADRAQQQGALISGLASAGGAILGGVVGTFVAPGLGTAAGASLGASLGGQLGGAAGGRGASYAPVQSNNFTSSANSLWSTALQTGIGMFNTGQPINGVNTFSNRNALTAAAPSGYSSASWMPSMGGWVPQPLTTGRTWTGSGFRTT